MIQKKVLQSNIDISVPRNRAEFMICRSPSTQVENIVMHIFLYVVFLNENKLQKKPKILYFTSWKEREGEGNQQQGRWSQLMWQYIRHWKTWRARFRTDCHGGNPRIYSDLMAPNQAIFLANTYKYHIYSWQINKSVSHDNDWVRRTFQELCFKYFATFGGNPSLPIFNLAGWTHTQYSLSVIAKL